jgi:cobalt-zinc-cadmium efflux system outer membrane protein
MRHSRAIKNLAVGAVFLLLPAASFCQQTFTWQQVRDKFEAGNPTLKVAELDIQESRANEITGYLRPNPDFTMLVDGTQVAPYQGIWTPFVGTYYTPGVSYLHERQRKR